MSGCGSQQGMTGGADEGVCQWHGRGDGQWILTTRGVKNGMQRTVRIGSEAHKELFCRSFIATHRVFDPEKLPWPDLEMSARDRLRALPFWEEAIATETEAGMKISAYAAQVGDDLLREAIALQGAEELRHAALLSTLVARYDIPVAKCPSARLSSDPEQAFIDVGYGECIDSFFAFGLFEVARRSGFFPTPLLQVVEPILDEEARHIVFFVNWEAYRLHQRGRGAAPWRALRALRYYGRAVRRRFGAFRSADGEGFTMSGSGSVTVDFTLNAFLQHCLRENDQRLAGFASDLLRPRFVPTLSALALRGLRLLSRRI
jgi:hypothetical protein